MFLISCLLSPVIGLLLIAIFPQQNFERVIVHNSLGDRLVEVNSPLEYGLITQGDYEARRKIIIENTDR